MGCAGGPENEHSGSARATPAFPFSCHSFHWVAASDLRCRTVGRRGLGAPPLDKVELWVSQQVPVSQRCVAVQLLQIPPGFLSFDFQDSVPLGMPGAGAIT